VGEVGGLAGFAGREDCGDGTAGFGNKFHTLCFLPHSLHGLRNMRRRLNPPIPQYLRLHLKIPIKYPFERRPPILQLCHEHLLLHLPLVNTSLEFRQPPLQLGTELPKRPHLLRNLRSIVHPLIRVILVVDFLEVLVLDVFGFLDDGGERLVVVH
jgi:hypothetical protein